MELWSGLDPGQDDKDVELMQGMLGLPVTGVWSSTDEDYFVETFSDIFFPSSWDNMSFLFPKNWWHMFDFKS